MNRDDRQPVDLADSKVIKQVKDRLDRSVNELPSHIRERLHSARKQAVAQAERARHGEVVRPLPRSGVQHRWNNLWRPFAPIASAAAFAAVIFYINVATTVPEIDPNDWEQDADLLFSADDFELYEDLEFYAWLAEVENG